MPESLRKLNGESIRYRSTSAKLQAAFIYYQRLQKVKNYVESNYEQQISLSKAARIAGLERKYFSAYFRKKTGVCFKDWVTEVRINRAKLMMGIQSHSITEIAYAVGFGDLRTFERAFKRSTGMTPREFKNSVRP